MLSKNVDIERITKDSYPVVVDINSNGTPIDLSDWVVDLYYNEVQPDASIQVIKISGVITNAKKGVVKFYPRTSFCYNVTLATAYAGFSVVGKHAYSVVQSGTRYEQDAAGTHVLVAGVYVLYDSQDPAHVDLQRYSQYTETITRMLGEIAIEDRPGA